MCITFSLWIWLNCFLQVYEVQVGSLEKVSPFSFFLVFFFPLVSKIFMELRGKGEVRKRDFNFSFYSPNTPATHRTSPLSWHRDQIEALQWKTVVTTRVLLVVYSNNCKMSFCMRLVSFVYTWWPISLRTHNSLNAENKYCRFSRYRKCPFSKVVGIWTKRDDSIK